MSLLNALSTLGIEAITVHVLVHLKCMLKKQMGKVGNSKQKSGFSAQQPGTKKLNDQLATSSRLAFKTESVIVLPTTLQCQQLLLAAPGNVSSLCRGARQEMSLLCCQNMSPQF